MGTDMNNQLMTIIKKPWFVTTMVGLSTFSVGLGSGYILGSRRVNEVIYSPDFEEGNNEQLNMFEDVYPMETTDQKPNLMRDLENEIREELSELEKNGSQFVNEARSAEIYWPSYQQEEEALLMLDEDELIELEKAIAATDLVVNVIAESDSTWDYEAERSTRTGKKPYVIHQDEYMGGEMDYGQSTITYYAGDDIMCDSQDSPMHRYKDTLGELKWGHGSAQDTVVYIRNERLEMEFEVLLDEGRYEIEVMGNHVERQYEEAELKHSSTPRRFSREE